MEVKTGIVSGLAQNLDQARMPLPDKTFAEQKKRQGCLRKRPSYTLCLQKVKCTQQIKIVSYSRCGNYLNILNS